MGLRFEFTDLQSLPGDRPSRIDLNGCGWRLYLQRIASTQTVNGLPITLMSTGIDNQGDLMELDFPPIFDATGRPVMWNQGLYLHPNGTGFRGVLVQIYWDPALPVQPSR